MKKFNRIIAKSIGLKPYFEIEYIENGEIHIGYGSHDFLKVLKWKEEDLDVKETVANENGETTYEQGLADAWEAARKIVAHVEDGGITADTLYEIFGTPFTDNIVIRNNATEAIAKIKAYEDKQQKIKVGDEVVKNDDISKCGVITYIAVTTVEGNKYSVLWDDGWSCWYYEKDIKKTGRHFPQVEKLLKTMKEE